MKDDLFIRIIKSVHFVILRAHVKKYDLAQHILKIAIFNNAAIIAEAICGTVKIILSVFILRT